jgi:hypothetical protein
MQCPNGMQLCVSLMQLFYCDNSVNHIGCCVCVFVLFEIPCRAPVHTHLCVNQLQRRRIRRLPLPAVVGGRRLDDSRHPAAAAAYIGHVFVLSLRRFVPSLLLALPRAVDRSSAQFAKPRRTRRSLGTGERSQSVPARGFRAERSRCRDAGRRLRSCIS